MARIAAFLTQLSTQWYIGAAKGEGTRVGNGAALFVFMLPLLAMRLHAPPAVAMIAIMATVTSILIVGYSWIDTHLFRVGNPGVGYRVAWRRALLVVIGAVSQPVHLLLPCLSVPSGFELRKLCDLVVADGTDKCFST